MKYKRNQRFITETETEELSKTSHTSYIVPFFEILTGVYRLKACVLEELGEGQVFLRPTRKFTRRIMRLRRIVRLRRTLHMSG